MDGIKYDNDKPQYRLIPPKAENEFVKVLTFGAKKYAPDNWKKIDKERYIDALGRHFNAYRRGETHDPESGLHHLAHVMCCAAFIVEKDTPLRPSHGDYYWILYGDPPQPTRIRYAGDWIDEMNMMEEKIFPSKQAAEEALNNETSRS